MPLIHITTCLLCNPAKAKHFESDPMPDIKPGEQPPPELHKFLNALGMHLNQKHNEAFQSIYQMGAMLQGFMLMQYFTSTDPGMMTASNLVRHLIHQITEDKAHRSDDWVRGFYESVIEDADPDSDAPFTLEDLLRFRDLMLEDGPNHGTGAAVTPGTVIIRP